MASVRVPWAYVNTEMAAWIHVREEQCSRRIKRPSNRGKHGYFAARADRTKYGTHPLAPKSFVPHHMQRLSVAAVKGDAKGVRAAANSLKRKVMGNAASAAAVGARA